jgi:imidazolonepropionase-like amidohydrolase
MTADVRSPYQRQSGHYAFVAEPLSITAQLAGRDEASCRLHVGSDGRFRDVGEPGSAHVSDVWLLPGLVDMHNHLSLASPAGDEAPASERVRASAAVERSIGVLAIREPGSPDRTSAELGDEPGWPRIVTMGRFLAPAHGYFPGLAREVTAEELATAACDEAGTSGGWAKIIADFLGEDGRFRPNWRDETMREAVDAVHARHGRVAVHCVCDAAVDQAIAAGVDSVEHGWAVSDDHFDEMIHKHIAWIPTLIPGGVDTACAFAHAMGASDETASWMENVIGGQGAAVARAHDAGVAVYVGTDAGQGPHAALVDQIDLMIAGGMPPAAVIVAASWSGREYLGLPTIEKGAPADFTLYATDPVKNPSVLRTPTMIAIAGVPIARPASPT